MRVGWLVAQERNPWGLTRDTRTRHAALRWAAKKKDGLCVCVCVCVCLCMRACVRARRIWQTRGGHCTSLMETWRYAVEDAFFRKHIAAGDALYGLVHLTVALKQQRFSHVAPPSRCGHYLPPVRPPEC
jgi:hypothetical protein